MTDERGTLYLQIDHRIGAPVAGDVLGTWTLPDDGGELVAVMGAGTTVLCCWPQRPRRRWRRWYVRHVVAPLHGALAARWAVAADRTAHVFVGEPVAAWQSAVDALNAARRRAAH